jgi:hypothetical protein
MRRRLGLAVTATLLLATIGAGAVSAAPPAPNRGCPDGFVIWYIPAASFDSLDKNEDDLGCARTNPNTGLTLLIDNRAP